MSDKLVRTICLGSLAAIALTFITGLILLLIVKAGGADNLALPGLGLICGSPIALFIWLFLVDMTSEPYEGLDW